MSGLSKEFFGTGMDLPSFRSFHILSRIFLDITEIPLWPDVDSKLSWLEGPDNFRNNPLTLEHSLSPRNSVVTLTQAGFLAIFAARRGRKNVEFLSFCLEF